VAEQHDFRFQRDDIVDRLIELRDVMYRKIDYARPAHCKTVLQTPINDRHRCGIGMAQEELVFVRMFS